MRYMIDTPPPFANKAEWMQFLRSLDGLDKNHPDVKNAIQEAKSALERLATS